MPALFLGFVDESAFNLAVDALQDEGFRVAKRTCKHWVAAEGGIDQFDSA